MTLYRPPVTDMLFVLHHVVGLVGLNKTAGLETDDVRTILEGGAQLASEVLAPLNASGDREGSRLENGAVKTPRGFKEAYTQFCEGGWNGVPFSPDHGGQGLPWVIAFALNEMWHGANTSFGLCPMLNLAAVEAIEQHGTPEQKKTYLDKLVSGEWTGTMNLTEPQAGTDLGLIKTTARKQPDGAYLIKGQKIFITYGEHDFTTNIIHMVLARLPGAPEGTKGISLFLVPKFIPDAQGNSGKRNDVACVSLEHKMGIHASPTCTMMYGDAGGAVGWLVGKENEGLKCMFTMMNNARLFVGLEGVAVAEAAYQKALSYARERVQGTRLTGKEGGSIAIIEHPDVQRMLLTMKAMVEAGRALTYEAARYLDLAQQGDEAAHTRVDLLTPVVKAWCTDMAVEVTSLGIQVHGGMGFIEEAGAAQFYRDARIASIYEGTNGVQAQDLVFRKIIRDGGAAFRAWLGEARKTTSAMPGLDAALDALEKATNNVLDAGRRNDPDSIAAVAAPYLKGFGLVAGGAMTARAAAIAAKKPEGFDDKFLQGKIQGAQFYATHILPQYRGALETVLTGGSSVTAAVF